MNLTELEQKIGLSFKDKRLYIQAFTHTSYVHEHRGARVHQDNERLEYLGDAVLELAVSEYLFHRYPLMSEGDLTRLRARVVCEASLSAFAKELGLGQYVRLGRGEEMTGGRHRPALLADLFEALIGALYLDAGMDEVRHLLQSVVFPRIGDDLLVQLMDAKSKLQEIVQQKGIGPLEYRIVDMSGPAHDRHFVAEVLVGTRCLGRGKGRSKKEAEQRAAAQGLKRISTVKKR